MKSMREVGASAGIVGAGVSRPVSSHGLGASSRRRMTRLSGVALKSPARKVGRRS